MNYLSIYSFIIPLSVFLFFFNRNKNTLLFLILGYIVYSFVNDLVYTDVNKAEIINHFLLISFTLIEYSVFAFFILKHLLSPNAKKALIALSILFYLFVFYTIIAGHLAKFDSLQVSIEALIIISFSVYYFFEQINRPEITFIYTEKSFWIICGFLIYMAGTFFLFLMSANLPKEELSKFWVISQLGNILKNVFFAIAFSIKPDAENIISANHKKPYNI